MGLLDLTWTGLYRVHYVLTVSPTTHSEPSSKRSVTSSHTSSIRPTQV
jgi:hypothetical protein